MRIGLLTAIGAAALATSSLAQAQVTVVDSSITEVDGPATNGDTTTIGFTEAGLASPEFTEFLTFTNALASINTITLDTSSAGVDFTSAILTGPGGPFELIKSFDNGTVELFQLSNFFLDAGTFTLTINGMNDATGSLAGTVTIGAGAVPEPGTWGMMLIGFGAVGYGMRRRRKSAHLPQIA